MLFASGNKNGLLSMKYLGKKHNEVVFGLGIAVFIDIERFSTVLRYGKQK